MKNLDKLAGDRLLRAYEKKLLLVLGHYLDQPEKNDHPLEEHSPNPTVQRAQGLRNELLTRLMPGAGWLLVCEEIVPGGCHIIKSKPYISRTDAGDAAVAFEKARGNFTKPRWISEGSKLTWHAGDRIWTITRTKRK